MKIGVIGQGKGGELIAEYLRHQDYTDDFCGASFEFFDEHKGLSLNEIPPDYKLIISSSNMTFRRRVFKMFPLNRWININRSEYYERIGVGNIIFPNVHFDYFAEVGHNNVISNGCIINHHCKIGNGNLLGPGCLLSGSVTIGNNCTIGSGVIFEPNAVLEDNCFITSGTVVFGHLLEGTKIIASGDGGVYQGDRIVKTLKPVI